MLSLGDYLLLQLCIRRAQNEPKKAASWIIVGMGLRYLLTAVILTACLFWAQINTVAVILTLLLQKIWLTICSLGK